MTLLSLPIHRASRLCSAPSAIIPRVSWLVSTWRLSMQRLRRVCSQAAICGTSTPRCCVELPRCVRSQPESKPQYTHMQLTRQHARTLQHATVACTLHHAGSACTMQHAGVVCTLQHAVSACMTQHAALACMLQHAASTCKTQHAHAATRYSCVHVASRRVSVHYATCRPGRCCWPRERASVRPCAPSPPGSPSHGRSRTSP